MIRQEVKMDWRTYVVADPAVCHGRATVRGTRVMVSVVLDNLASGTSAEEILASYPGLTSDSVRAVIAYAAELARERFVSLPSLP